MKFAAVLFDCDGVLVDSEPITNGVLREMLVEKGWDISQTECMRIFVGKALKDEIRQIEERTGFAVTPAWLAEFAERRNQALIQRVVAIPKVVDTVRQVHAHYKGQIACASGADRAKVVLQLGKIGLLDCFEGRIFIALAVAMIMATTNAANLTDGLDGLLTGTGVLVFGVFAIIAFWQFRHEAIYSVPPAQALDLMAVAAALVGACTGFLWWNAAPARVFMGDTGSMAIGGAMAGLALLTNTQLLLPILAGLCLVETLSVIAQVISFRGFGRRILRMSPIHHHFELKGWPETTVTIRFWIFAGACAALALGLFYADFLRVPGVTD